MAKNNDLDYQIISPEELTSNAIYELQPNQLPKTIAGQVKIMHELDANIQKARNDMVKAQQAAIVAQKKVSIFKKNRTDKCRKFKINKFDRDGKKRVMTRQLFLFQHFAIHYIQTTLHLQR